MTAERTSLPKSQECWGGWEGGINGRKTEVSCKCTSIPHCSGQALEVPGFLPPGYPGQGGGAW